MKLIVPPDVRLERVAIGGFDYLVANGTVTPIDPAAPKDIDPAQVPEHLFALGFAFQTPTSSSTKSAKADKTPALEAQEGA